MAWTRDDARDMYAIAHWSDGYFDIDDRGEVIVYPSAGRTAGGVSLCHIAREVRNEGLSLPVLVRFTDILRDRVRLLTAAFENAMAEQGYRGGYTPVYPIKVNQQRSVVETILHSEEGRVGLEAGSKSELLAILALAQSATVICNGYKDRAYIRLALIGIRLGLNVFIVIEKLSELELVLEESRALDITPQLGVRVRLTSIGAGKWQNSGGEKSKFGLHAMEVLRLIQRLKEVDRLGRLRLMHFHVGSQVANVHDIKTALREAGRYYAELRRLGAPVEYVDVGGGLGVDYEGTHSASDCSINYSIEEYAQSVVRAVAESCAEYGLPHPHLITESGRAMSAHHAVLITHVIDVESVAYDPRASFQPSAQPLRDLAGLLARVDREPVLGIYHDACFDLAEARSMYIQGRLGLDQLAEAERLHAAVCHEVQRRLDIRLRAHRKLHDELNERLADKIFCNFSVFQSIPDAWAIQQIFPVLPLQRLNEEPQRRAVIQDLTCDSDGQIKAYVDRQSIESTLPVHELIPGEPYLIGIFLVGAYQEILGDMHNLFGDTHSVDVRLDGQGGCTLTQTLRGDGSDHLLRYVHVDPEELMRSYRKKLNEANVPSEKRRLFESELIAGLSGYTYLEG